MAEVIEPQFNNQTPAQPPVTTGKQRKIKLPKGRNLLIIAIIAVAALAAAFYLMSKDNKNDTAPTQAPYHYEYKDYVNTTFPGQGPGKGVSFKLPKVFDGIAKRQGKDFLEYSQYAQNKDDPNKTVLISRLTINTVDTSKYHQDSYVKAVGGAMSKKNKDDKLYQSILVGVDYYLAKSFFNSENITTTKSDPTEFKTANITKNAWVFDIKAQDKNGAMPEHTGKLVYVIGKNSSYYFLISAESANWNSQQDYFKQVQDSIKVDL